jgi:cobalamin biosynthesis protein CobT
MGLVVSNNLNSFEDQNPHIEYDFSEHTPPNEVLEPKKVLINQKKIDNDKSTNEVEANKANTNEANKANTNEANKANTNEANKANTNEANKADTNETNEDETNEDESNEDESNEDETNEDETNEDETNEDETNEDETNEDETNEDETNEDETNEDETNEDETNEDETNEDETNDLSFEHQTQCNKEIQSSIHIDETKFIDTFKIQSENRPDLFVLVYNNYILAYSLSLTELRVSVNQLRLKLLRELFSKDPTRNYQTHIYAVDELKDDVVFQLRIFSYPKNNILQVQKIEETIQIISVSHALYALDNIEH